MVNRADEEIVCFKSMVLFIHKALGQLRLLDEEDVMSCAPSIFLEWALDKSKNCPGAYTRRDKRSVVKFTFCFDFRSGEIFLTCHLVVRKAFFQLQGRTGQSLSSDAVQGFQCHGFGCFSELFSGKLYVESTQRGFV